MTKTTAHTNNRPPRPTGEAVNDESRGRAVEETGARGRRASAGGVARVTLIGNLGADPEVRHTGEGRASVRFRVAVNAPRRDRQGAWEEHTDWYAVTAFGPLAERAGDRLARGLRVFVQGRLQSRTWQTPDGETRCFHDVVADDVVPLERIDDPRDGEAESDSSGEPGDVPF